MSEQHETHRMGRRCQKKNYRLPGTYHITVNVAERKWQPLGQVVGNLDKPDGNADAPRVELTNIGKMVEEELTKSITAHYPMIEVQDYVVMPEHIHFIAVVHHDIISLTDLYHPSERRIELCATNKLLIVTPWRYIYRHTHEPISVAECKTMNCIVQALCRTKDSWWINKAKI